MIPSEHPRAFLVFLGLLLAAPLPLGSNRDWAWPILAAVVFLLVAQLSLRPAPLAPVARRQLVLLLLLALWMLIQLTGLPPLTGPLTLEAAPTRDALLKTLTLAGFAWLTLRLVRDGRSAAWTIQALVVGATLQVAIAVYQLVDFSAAAAQATGPTGFRARGTYASPNHLAGMLHQVLGLALGLLLHDHARRAGAPWREQLLDFVTGAGLRLRLLVVVLAAGLVLTLSRGGNAAFVTALVVVTFLAGLARGRVSRGVLIVSVSVLLVDVALIGQHYGLEQLQERVSSTTVEGEFRVDLVRYHLEMIRDQLPTGSGAGTYETLVTRYRDEFVPARLTHAENDYFEFLIELGMPGGLLLALFLFGALRQQWRLLRRDAAPALRGLTFGCLTATTAMLLHGLVDFNLRIPANAMLLVLALTIPFALDGAPGPADRDAA